MFVLQAWKWLHLLGLKPSGQLDFPMFLLLCQRVCFGVSGCDPDLFRKILQLRERRWDLEEMLVEAGKSADALKKESDGLITKVVPPQRGVSEHPGSAFLT